MSKYSVIVPVLNEEKIINLTYSRLRQVMDSTKEEYELIFVNDGSIDTTEDLIKLICEKDKHVKLINFARNFGHQIAISAGLDHSNGDAIIIIDADLQDPPETILEMIKKWKEGFDVVYGKRIQRKGETFFKKFTAYMFYRLLKYLTGDYLPVDSGDFRLIDHKVRDALTKFGEKSRYVRGLINWVGFKQTFVEYVREERQAGKTKYPFNKMLHFAIDAITSFSNRPLRISTYLGFTLSALSFLYVLYAIYQKLFTSNTILGWTSLIAVTLFFNGIILVILGILGEYIGRIYEETKGRPLYILKNKAGFE